MEHAQPSLEMGMGGVGGVEFVANILCTAQSRDPPPPTPTHSDELTASREGVELGGGIVGVAAA